MNSILGKLRFCTSLILDRKTPWYVRILIIAGLVYLLFPLDFVSDNIPILGWVDDVTIAGALIALALRLVPEEVVKRKSRMNNE